MAAVTDVLPSYQGSKLEAFVTSLKTFLENKLQTVPEGTPERQEISSLLSQVNTIAWDLRASMDLEGTSGLAAFRSILENLIQLIETYKDDKLRDWSDLKGALDYLKALSFQIERYISEIESKPEEVDLFVIMTDFEYLLNSFNNFFEKVIAPLGERITDASRVPSSVLISVANTFAQLVSQPEISTRLQRLANWLGINLATFPPSESVSRLFTQAYEKLQETYNQLQQELYTALGIGIAFYLMKASAAETALLLDLLRNLLANTSPQMTERADLALDIGIKSLGILLGRVTSTGEVSPQAQQPHFNTVLNWALTVLSRLSGIDLSAVKEFLSPQRRAFAHLLSEKLENIRKLRKLTPRPLPPIRAFPFVSPQRRKQMINEMRTYGYVQISTLLGAFLDGLSLLGNLLRNIPHPSNPRKRISLVDLALELGYNDLAAKTGDLLTIITSIQRLRVTIVPQLVWKLLGLLSRKGVFDALDDFANTFLETPLPNLAIAGTHLTYRDLLFHPGGIPLLLSIGQRLKELQAEIPAEEEEERKRREGGGGWRDPWGLLPPMAKTEASKALQLQTKGRKRKSPQHPLQDFLKKYLPVQEEEKPSL